MSLSFSWAIDVAEPLGRDLSRLVLGTMLLTDSGFDVLDEYVRLGGNAIDTARVYGDGEAVSPTEPGTEA